MGTFIVIKDQIFNLDCYKNIRKFRLDRSYSISLCYGVDESDTHDVWFDTEEERDKEMQRICDFINNKNNTNFSRVANGASGGGGGIVSVTVGNGGSDGIK